MALNDPKIVDTPKTNQPTTQPTSYKQTKIDL